MTSSCSSSPEKLSPVSTPPSTSTVTAGAGRRVRLECEQVSDAVAMSPPAATLSTRRTPRKASTAETAVEDGRHEVSIVSCEYSNGLGSEYINYNSKNKGTEGWKEQAKGTVEEKAHVTNVSCGRMVRARKADCA